MPLRRSRIISAAMELIEREGLEAVSMRRLATELGCGLVALYSYVPSAEALLDGVADAVVSCIGPAPAASWEDQLVAQARAFRTAARAHPRCAAITASRPARSQARSRLRSLEHALAALRAAGLSRPDAVRTVRAFAAYALGSVLGEAGASAPSAASTPATIHGRLEPAEFPQVTDLAAELTRQEPEADFEFGLRLLVRATAALLSAEGESAA